MTEQIDNHQGMCLQSAAGQVLARVMITSLTDDDYTVDTGRLPERQCGVRPGRCTVDITLSLRQLSTGAV